MLQTLILQGYENNVCPICLRFNFIVIEVAINRANIINPVQVTMSFVLAENVSEVALWERM